MEFSRCVFLFGGDEEDRTPDPLLAGQVLSQLSYAPTAAFLVGLSGLEPLASRLSGVRSDQLSYRPPSLASEVPCGPSKPCSGLALGLRFFGRSRSFLRLPSLPRKEVIQPHLPIRLPCYDFTPIIRPALDGWLLFRLPRRLRVLLTFVV